MMYVVGLVNGWASVVSASPEDALLAIDKAWAQMMCGPPMVRGDDGRSCRRLVAADLRQMGHGFAAVGYRGEPG